MVGQNYQNHGCTDLPGAQATPAEQAKPIYCPIFLIFSVLKVFRKCTYFYRFVAHLAHLQYVRYGGMAMFSRFSHASGTERFVRAWRCAAVVACVVRVVCREVRVCRACRAVVLRVVAHRCGGVECVAGCPWHPYEDSPYPPRNPLKEEEEAKPATHDMPEIPYFLPVILPYFCL